MRLLFVGDRLPAELVRLIEFLNEQMRDAEVLGIELRQFVSDTNQRAFVPTVIGRTSRAVESKTTGATGTAWDRQAFMTAAEERRPAAEVAFIERLFDHVDQRGGHLVFGKGVTPGLSGWYPLDGVARPVFNLNVNEDKPGRHAYVSLYVKELRGYVGSERVEKALQVLEQSELFGAQVEQSRALDYRKWTRAFLPDLLADTDGHIIIDAIDALIDG